MKIVLTANTTWNLVNFRSSLMQYLVNSGHEVIVAAPPDAAVKKLHEAGIRHYPIHMDQQAIAPAKDAMVIARYLQLFRQERPDVVFGFTIKANIYGAIAARVFAIPFLPNISGLGTAFLRSGWMERLATTLYRVAFRKVSIVFFQNADDLALFVEKKIVSTDQARPIPGSGIDLRHFRPGRENKTKKQEIVFLLIARLLRDKGVGEFVEAARIVGTKYSNARFQLLGQTDAPNRTAIDRQTVDQWVDAGFVEYLGTAEDVRGYIKAADCVVLPSYREGAPRSLLEAAAMAKPLIATDVPGCREVVENGVNGFLCEARNATDLAAKIDAFLSLDDSERQEMGRQSRKLVEKKFDVKFVIDAYGRALDHCARGTAKK
jgi:glycosyltransferase involved in cell wall biosynthesis